MDQEKIKINEVGKTFFEIQFDAKENIINRLNNEINDFNNKTEKFKGKTHRLSNKLRDNYEYLKKILDEKNNLEKILKAETAQLKQEANSMVETGIIKLKEKNDEFMREAGKIKSITAIYVGRLNKLDEFFKQEKLLEQKYTDIKEQNLIADKNYVMALKNMEENKIKSEKILERNMVKRCVDFVLHMEKLSLMAEWPVKGVSDNEILDLNEMLEIGNKQNAIYEQKCLDLKEENKVLQQRLKSNREIIRQKNIEDCLKKKNGVKISESELVNSKDLPVKDTVWHAAQPSYVINVHSDEAELQSVDHDLHAAQVELYDIRSANQLLDRRIWKAEDALLNVYEKAAVRLEEIKSDTNDSEEKMVDFIRNLCKEFECFIIEEDK